jgi:hypothetical protein
MARISQRILMIMLVVTFAVGTGLVGGAAAAQDKQQNNQNNTKSVSQQDKMNACKSLADRRNVRERTAGPSSRTV